MTPPRVHPFLSTIPGIEWPPVITGNVAPMAALVTYLEATQWLSSAELERRALRQLSLLAEHCIRESPLFAERMRLAGLSASDLAEPGNLQKLPPMTRRRAQEAGDRLFCRLVPPEHKPLHEGRTSGSTGEPLTVKRTIISYLFRQANLLRDHLWHRRDFSQPVASIRQNHAAIAIKPTWGVPVDLMFASGQALEVPVSTPVVEQVKLLRAHRPAALQTFPNNLSALIDEMASTGGPPPELKHIRTLSETVSQDLRKRSIEFFGSDIEDIYGTADTGIVAIQCPDCGRYHVNAETILLEVINDRGVSCAAGEIGRVVVTDFTNFATPMIRYEIGDYAEVGTSDCGRGLPSLNRILGRRRNLIVMPDGTRRFPVVGFYAFREIAPILQFQFVQIDRRTVEANLVVGRDLTFEEESGIRDVVTRNLNGPFSIVFKYHREPLPRGPNGKFEEFVCRLPD